MHIGGRFGEQLALLLPSPVRLHLFLEHPPPPKALPRGPCIMFLKISFDIGQFLIKIWDATAKQLKHLRMPEPRVRKLEKTMARLMVKEEDINNSISQAQREGKIPTNEIQHWINEVTELKRTAAAIGLDFELRRRRCLCGLSWNCFSVNRRVAKRLDEIDQLMKQANDIPVATIQPPPAVVQIPTSNSTLEMEPYMGEILGHIASAKAAGVIGVYGMGGVGKTTLLSNINNHRDVAVFDHVIWAVASKECKMERLQRDIAKRLKLYLHEDDSEEECATRLLEFMKDKDCLLLLDDLWEPLNLAKLGMAHAPSGQGEQKRKIVVFTTRHEQVCSSMKARRRMEIKCLEPEQAWELFRRNAGEDAIGSDAGIDRIAHLIVKECGGLPLALVTIGKAMSTKKSWEAWNDALRLMNHSQMPKVSGMKKIDPMFSAFKLSYDSLEDDDTRGRLLSCALWPEDHLIDKESLIECWMGLDLIDEVDAIHEAYNQGYSHIETLIAACLLELDDFGEAKVKMHDVIRDMALWMASDCGKKKFKWIVKARVVANQAPEEGWCEAERVSLMYSRIASLPNQISTCSELLVLMLQSNHKQLKICGSLIQAMHALTYLDLEDTWIGELPKEIGMLSQLQHLNLSLTPINKLPAELGCLVKLKYLLLRETYNLTAVAKGAISKLWSLRLLDLRGSKYEDCWDELESMQGCQKCIGINISTPFALLCLCLLPRVSIWRLNVKNLWYSGNLNHLLDDIMSCPNIWQSLEELIIDVRGMDKLLISEGNEEASGLQCLKYLALSHLCLLRDIRWNAVQSKRAFPNLREVSIYKCHRLRNVNWTLHLPSLTVLVIYFCVAMEELISDEGISTSFVLRRMTLFQMPKLKRISPRPLYFPYLEEINVLFCPRLRKLPFENRGSVNRLKEINCRRTWWDELEWEEISIKHSLSPLVTRFIPDLPDRVAFSDRLWIQGL